MLKSFLLSKIALAKTQFCQNKANQDSLEINLQLGNLILKNRSTNQISYQINETLVLINQYFDIQIENDRMTLKLSIAFIVLSITKLTFSELGNSNDSYQELSVIHQNIVSIDFRLISQQQPLLIQKIIQDFDLTQIRVKMGSRFRHDLQTKLPHNGIFSEITYRQNVTKTQQKQDQLLKILSGIFYLSVNSEFVIPSKINQNDTIYVSNPNDKFCSEQLESLIRTFLPCKNLAGLGSLLSSKVFFTRKYVGAQIVWTKQQISIHFYIEKNPGFQNIVNTKFNVCQGFKVTQASNWMNKTISPGKPLIKQLSQSLRQFESMKPVSQSHRDFSLYSIKSANPARYVRGKWYSYARQKQLIHTYKVFSIEQLRLIDYLIFQELFPKGFEVISVKCTYERQNQQINIPTQIQIQKRREKTTLVIVKALVNFTEESQRQNTKLYVGSFRLTIKYRSLIRSFTEYQAIAGGGQQFMRLPLLIVKKGQKAIQVKQVLDISDKIMEPDFSIPFHVMTFFSALFGYIWVSIWRLFLSKKTKSQKKEKQN